MTKAQLEKLLGVTLSDGKDTYSDDEAFELINKSHSDLRSELSKNKDLLSKRNGEIAEYKRREQDKMTDEEKRTQEFTDLQNKVASYEKAISKNNKVTEYMGIGYPKELAEKIADAEIEGKSTAKFHQEFITATEERVKADLLKDGSHKAHTNDNDTPPVTKEQYNKMTYSQKLEFKETNPELYAEFSKK